MTEPCAVQAQVHTDSGYISIVHELPEYHDGKPSSGKRDEVKVDSLQKFKVDWADTSAVTDLASDPAASCESLGGSKLLCDVTITDSQAFLEVPSKNEIAATLKIGAAQPSMFDSGAYSRSTALSTDEVGVYVDSSNGLSIATIFEVELYAGYTQYVRAKRLQGRRGGPHNTVCGRSGRERSERQEGALLRRERANDGAGGGASEASDKKVLFCGGSEQTMELEGAR
jgi:hypothetical protein